MSKPRIGVVGPLLGIHPGWAISPAEIVISRLREDGFTVRATSTKIGRISRLTDTVQEMLSWRNQVDLIIVVGYSGLAFGMGDLSTWLAKRLKKPIIIWLQGGNLPTFAKRYPRWIQRVFSRADAVAAPSGYLAQHFQEIGFDVHIIPNLLDIEAYTYRQRDVIRPNLLWMRTFHPIYHPEMAVHALHKLVQDGVDATLTMAGQDRGLLETTQKLVQDYELDDRVRFPGFLDLAAKQREFGSHDIYLHTNRIDNMPVSVLEAGGFGLPVIATRVGGIPYLLEDEQTGLIVPDEDAAEMANAIQRLVSAPALAARISQNGRQLAESCTWPIVKQQWQALFTQLL